MYGHLHVRDMFKAFNVLYEKMIACNICILNNCKIQMHAFADFLIQL